MEKKSKEEITRFYHSNLPYHEHLNNLELILRQVQKDRGYPVQKTFCVIENISSFCRETLSRAWSVDPGFFADHLRNPAQETLWKHNTWQYQSPPTNDTGTRGEQQNTRCWQQLRGIFEYHDSSVTVDALRQSYSNCYPRAIFKDGTWPANVSTVISYYRVYPNFYVFLVDAPIELENPMKKSNDLTSRYLRPTLRFQYSGNRGGLLLPHPSHREVCSPLELLTNTFQHKWQLDLIFSTPEIFPNVPLLYILSNSAWETNFRELDNRIKEICLRKIRTPHTELIDSLHDLREDLSGLRASIDETIFYAEPAVQEYFENVKKRFPDVNMRQTPVKGHEAIQIKAAKLNTFFVENIQLLLSIISIRDAQQSIQQTEQSMILTGLATIYLPLSLATGIFGMNIYEMTGNGVRVWVFIVSCAAIFLLTCGIIGWIFRKPLKMFITGKAISHLIDLQSPPPEDRKIR